MKINTAFAAALVLVAAMAAVTNAQETWGGYSSSCDRQGRCHHGYYNHGANSIDLIPYGRTSYQPNRSPFRDELGYSPDYASSAGCGYGGTCPGSQYSSQYGVSQFGLGTTGSSSCSGGRCPYEQDQFGSQFDNRPGAPYAYGQNQQPEYGANNYTNPESYSNPRQRAQDWYGVNPADQRPELNSSSIAPRTNFAPNNSRSESSNSQLVPPTSTQIMPPPQLPPQPSANLNQRSTQGSRYESSPQLLPPTNSGSNQIQKADDPHAGHDHSGHDHAGHNHNH